MKKGYILILSLILVMLTMSCVSAGFLDGLFGGNNENKNITLIKESTSGWVTIYDDDGSVASCYMVEGVLKDLPDNVEGYNLRIALYDDEGNLIKEDDGDYLNYEDVNTFKKSNPKTLCFISVDRLVNVSIAEVKLYDKEGMLVLDKNVTFHMENVKITHATHTTSSSSSSDSSDEVRPLYRNLSDREMRDIGKWD